MKMKNVENTETFDGVMSFNFRIKRESDWRLYKNLKKTFDLENEYEMTQGEFFKTLLRKYSELVGA